MPDEWRKSVLIPIYKDKGDSKECGNYRGIKLMSHTMKWWERVVEARLRQEVVIGDQQFGFMPRRSTTDAIFGLRMTLIPQTRQTTKCGSAAFMLGKNGFERRFKRHVAVLFKVTMGCIATSVASSEPKKPRDGTDIQPNNSCSLCCHDTIFLLTMLITNGATSNIRRDDVVAFCGRQAAAALP